MSNDRIQIGERAVGDNQPCFVIAEAGVNHNGRLDLALKLIDSAVEAGADAVKFQTFKASRVVTRSAGQAAYQRRNMGAETSQLEMLSRLELSEADHRRLVKHCCDGGILFISTPFDRPSADLLFDLGVEAFKLPSGEITNTPFIRYVAGKQRPLIVSTGMCNLGEVETAVREIRDTANQDLILLHCVSNYPADPADVNLRAMATMRTAFACPIGYSDHTLGIEVALASVSLGACVVEKHMTLDRQLPGPDHQASIEPRELKSLIDGIRMVESAFGTGIKRPADSELDTMVAARKSLVLAVDVPAGGRLTDEVIAIKRPGSGLPPNMKPHLLNRRTAAALPAGHVIRLEDVA